MKIAIGTPEGQVNRDLTQQEIDEILAKKADAEMTREKREAVNAIADLEALQTPRRLREAALGIDNGYLAQLNAQIEVLRIKL